MDWPSAWTVILAGKGYGTFHTTAKQGCCRNICSEFVHQVSNLSEMTSFSCSISTGYEETRVLTESDVKSSSESDAPILNC